MASGESTLIETGSEEAVAPFDYMDNRQDRLPFEMEPITGLGSNLLATWRLIQFFSWILLTVGIQFIFIALRHPAAKWWPRVYHKGCCRLLGIRVAVEGEMHKEPPVLFVCNHTSYLDIVIMGSLFQGSFISKADVADWPLFGFLAKLQRTLFIDRRVRSTADQRDVIADRLKEPTNLVLFPEGTSGDGNRVLPFKSALFATAAVRLPRFLGKKAAQRRAEAKSRAEAKKRAAAESSAAATEGEGAAAAEEEEQPVLVQPVSIAYTHLDGMPLGRALRPFYAWYGDMELAPHLWEVASLGRLTVTVRFHEPVTMDQIGSRKALADHCWRQVSAGVSSLLCGRPQSHD